jgi:hypothetical protein
MSDPNCAADLAAAPERTREVEQLFFQNYGFITELSLSDPRLTFDDVSMIVEGIAKQLRNYDGELSDRAFQNWLTDVILPVRDFYAIRRTCAPYVKAAIRRVLSSALDFGVTTSTYREAELNTWTWCFEHLEQLRDPGAKASPQTRLYSAATFQALTIRKSLKRTRDRFGGARDCIDPERVSRDDEKGEYVVEPRAERDSEKISRWETISAGGSALNQ